VRFRREAEVGGILPAILESCASAEGGEEQEGSDGTDSLQPHQAGTGVMVFDPLNDPPVEEADVGVQRAQAFIQAGEHGAVQIRHLAVTAFQDLGDPAPQGGKALRDHQAELQQQAARVIGQQRGARLYQPLPGSLDRLQGLMLHRLHGCLLDGRVQTCA
jgi:hypothetical protein